MAEDRLTDFEKAIRGIGQAEEERTRNFMESNFPIAMRDRQPVQDVADFYNRRAAMGQAARDTRLQNRANMASALGVDEETLDALMGDAFAEEEPNYLGYPALNAKGPRHPTEGWQPYVAGDEFDLLQRIPTEGLRRYQERMIALGLMDSATLGRIDNNTINGFKSLLEFSNQNGMHWTAALKDLETMGEQGLLGDMGGSGSGDRQPFVADTYLAPDYATLAQTVKTQLRNELGREPDESELALLTAELSGWDREAFDAEVAQARADYDAAETGRDVAPTAQAVDPLARFRESFEQKFKGELRGIERTEEAAETNEQVRGAVSTLSRMSGGMG